MKKTFAIALLFASSLLNANQYEFSGKDVFSSQELGNITVSLNDGKFFVSDSDGNHEIQCCFLSKEIREMGPDNFKKFLDNDGYVSVSKMSDGEYSLRAHGRVRGGGPVAGAIGYWATKVLGYGGLAAGAGALAVTTGGTAVALVSGAGAAAAGSAVAAGAGTAAIAGVSGATAAGAVAGGLATAGAGAATGAAGAAVAGAGGLAAVPAAIETAAVGVSFGLTVCPFLP